MKKLTAGLLTAAVMMSGITAFAADGAITSISIDPDTQYITVTGTINSDNDRDRVTLRVTRNGDIPNESTILCTYQVNTDENGVYSFGFSMPDGAGAAEYDAYIKSDGADEAQQSFRYFGDVSSVLSSQINGASNASALRTFLESDNNAGMEMFGMDYEGYGKLSENGKLFAVSALFETKNKLNGFSSGSQLRDAFAQALLIAQIREGITDINDDNIAALSINYSEPADGGYAVFGTMYETAKKSGASTMTKALTAVKSERVKDTESFWAAYNDSVTSTVIAGTEYWTEVRDFIADNQALIGEHASINWSTYANVAESVCKTLVRGSYSGLDSFAEALKSAAAAATVNTGSTGGAGGGGGGGTGGSGIKSSSVSMSAMTTGGGGIPTAASSAVQYAFDDVRRTPWANDAITSLVERSIIDGYGDGTFRPEQHVTRAEFVTLVIRAFYPNTESMDCDFTDVPKDLWSYPYIAAASSLGIINGIGDNLFAPDANIKRQDMAVIIRNILVNTGRAAGAAEAQPFGDEAAVSDYALEAVKMLKAEGIVNGDENNNFNPLSEATRAEASVIIYNMLSK